MTLIPVVRLVNICDWPMPFLVRGDIFSQSKTNTEYSCFVHRLYTRSPSQILIWHKKPRERIFRSSYWLSHERLKPHALCSRDWHGDAWANSSLGSNIPSQTPFCSRQNHLHLHLLLCRYVSCSTKACTSKTGFVKKRLFALKSSLNRFKKHLLPQSCRWSGAETWQISLRKWKPLSNPNQQI